MGNIKIKPSQFGESEYARRITTAPEWSRKTSIPEEGYDELRNLLKHETIPAEGLSWLELRQAGDVLGHSTAYDNVEDIFAELKAWQKENNITVSEES